MKNFEKVRDEGLASAHKLLSSAPRDDINAALIKWWDEELKPRDESVPHVHADAAEVALYLRAAQLKDIADLIEREKWLDVGPVHPGQWGLAALLGESAASAFLAALECGEWFIPQFYGLDNCGAWLTFEDHLRKKLGESASSRELALLCVRRFVEEIKNHPESAFLHPDARSPSVRQEIDRFLSGPTIDAAWHDPLDTWIRLNWAFLVNALIAVRCEGVVEIISELQHPSLVKGILRTTRNEREADEIAYILGKCPTAFDYGEKFRSHGSAAIVALSLAEVAIRATAWDEEGRLKVVQSGKIESLDTEWANLQSAVHQILQVLFLRPDAVALAWAWIMHLTSKGGSPDCLPPDTNTGMYLDARMYLVESIARRLEPRDDWKEWIRTATGFQRVWRAIGAAIVQSFHEPPIPYQTTAPLEELFAETVEFPASTDLLGDSRNLLTSQAARIILSIDQPDEWIRSQWGKLRAIREKGWLGQRDRPGYNNSAQLFIAFAISTLSATSQADLRIKLWAAVEECVRDAIQTEPYADVFWSRALAITFENVTLPDNPDSPGDYGPQLSAALLPYISFSRNFMDIIVTLQADKFSLEDLRLACSARGFDLTRMIEHYLAMLGKKQQIKGFDKQHVERLKKLCNP